MKILSATQIRKADAYTIENEPIASIDLMERAAKAFVEWFDNQFSKSKPIFIYCGTGNNGGDGLAIARLLLKKEYQVSTFIVKLSKSFSPDFTTNLNRLEKLLPVDYVEKPSDIQISAETPIVFDALFGSGLSRPVTGKWGEIIKAINSIEGTKIAIDIASGLSCDNPFNEGEIVEVDHTVSFQLPKLAFFARDNFSYVGNWHVVDIGLDENFIEKQPASNFSIDLNLAKSIYKPRQKFAHKGTYGRSLLVTGSLGKMGASILASRACLHSGTGLLTIYAPHCGYEILQTSVPEAMVLIDNGLDYIRSIPETDNFSAIGVGPGIDTHKETAKAIQKLFENWAGPTVIDADAINILAENRHLLNIIPVNSIITPHPKEFERLIGSMSSSFKNWNYQLEFSRKYQVFIVLKGAHTSISTPNGDIYFNTTGNPGMATGGSGDVLTGLITGLLAQGYSPQDASIMGVFLHGLSGDLMAKERTQEGLIAGDLVEGLPQAFRLLS